MGEHARLSPSDKAWPACPGSIREAADYPDIPGSAAIDGTGSHILLEMCLLNGVTPITYDGQIIGANHPDNPNGWMVDPDRCARVQMALDYINRRHEELMAEYPGCEITIEAEGKSNPGELFGRHDWWGTCDITLTVTLDGRVVLVEVADYKDGRGYVDAKNNSQLRSYAGGKLRSFIDLDDPPLFRLTIIQPKTNPVIRFEGMTRDELLEAVRVLHQAANATDDPHAPLTAGSHCQWCPANPKRGGHCTAGAEQGMEAMKAMTNDVKIGGDKSLFEAIEESFGDVTKLDGSGLSDLADLKDSLLAQFQRVDAEIARRLDTGDDVPGYAMRPGRGSNKWNISEEELVKVLRGRRMKKGDCYVSSVLSPAQVQKSKLLTDSQKKSIADKYVDYTPGKLTVTKVARVTKPTAAEMFADVNKETEEVPSFI